MTILGPAGIGKTRLGRELSRRVEATGGVALWGRSLPYEERSPYRAAGQIIRKVANIYENDGVDVARDKLAGTVSSLYPEAEADEATRYLSVVLGLGLDEPPDEVVHLRFAARMFVERLAARTGPRRVRGRALARDERLLRELADALERFTARRTLVIVLEDLQWSDASTLDLAPLAPLDPLTSDQAVTVATALLPEVGKTAIERVVAAGEGNPLFLEELAASVTNEAGPESCRRPCSRRSRRESTPSRRTLGRHCSTPR